MTAVLAAFDPALNAPGAALFVDGILRFTATVAIDRALKDLQIGDRIDRVAMACTSWYHNTINAVAFDDNQNGIAFADTLTIVYEKPQIYGHASTKDPNDALHIGLVASAIAARLRVYRADAVIISPTPREWTKGSKALKKNSSEIWSHQRGIMIARRLSEVERELVPDKHDALDAVGLGLFGLGRLAAIRVNARPSAAKR